MANDKKKFSLVSIEKLTGGKDARRMVQDFIVKRGFDPDECKKGESDRWVLPADDEDEVEILLEDPDDNDLASIYIGMPVCAVPLDQVNETLISALRLADGLVEAKISLVGHYIVLSGAYPLALLRGDDLDYMYRLLIDQRQWLREQLCEELGWEILPAE